MPTPLLWCCSMNVIKTSHPYTPIKKVEVSKTKCLNCGAAGKNYFLNVDGPIREKMQKENFWEKNRLYFLTLPRGEKGN